MVSPPLTWCEQAFQQISTDHLLVISALQCHPAVPSRASHQCCPAVMPVSDHHCCISVQHNQCLLINAHQCRLISAAYQCPSVLPIRATSSMPISAAYQ
ncbi:unnamed protein product, partial [Staurois parvus]